MKETKCIAAFGKSKIKLAFPLQNVEQNTDDFDVQLMNLKINAKHEGGVTNDCRKLGTLAIEICSQLQAAPAN